jgi:hypothetical protein
MPAIALGATFLLLAACTMAPQPRAPVVPASGVIGVNERQLDSQHWIHRQHGADRVLLDAQAIAAQNEKLRRLDPSVTNLESLPGELTREQVLGWIGRLSVRPDRTIFDEQGHEIGADTIDGWMQSLNLSAVSGSVPARYGLAVRRADLRTFPTRRRVFSERGDTDIDRFQESALFPGTPVVMVHESSDGKWWFVVSAAYAAWVEKMSIAEGSAKDVFEYTHKTPYVVITGAKERTVFTPERPEVSELQLDMGVRVPLLTNLPPDEPINGQHPYASYVIELPTRKQDGTLAFVPALLPKTSDVAADYLPLSRANLLSQSFKFLGERYGWGHSYDARDCSGFVSDVYRSFGVELPRNTDDQAVTPAMSRISLSKSDSHEARLAALEKLDVGDLIYIPGHVMMVIGREDGMLYVIHDTTGITYRNENEELIRMPLNAVSVTPLTPLRWGSSGDPTIDHIYSIVRIHSRATP